MSEFIPVDLHSIFAEPLSYYINLKNCCVEDLKCFIQIYWQTTHTTHTHTHNTHTHVCIYIYILCARACVYARVCARDDITFRSHKHTGGQWRINTSTLPETSKPPPVMHMLSAKLRARMSIDVWVWWFLDGSPCIPAAVVGHKPIAIPHVVTCMQSRWKNDGARNQLWSIRVLCVCVCVCVAWRWWWGFAIFGTLINK